MKFPLRWLHQIEMTSHCNLRCKYCASPILKRPKLHMSDEHYDRALQIVRHCHVKYRQPEVNVAGIGESTMHPKFVENVFKAREVAGASIQIVITTNGLLMTRELAKEIAPAKPIVFVSLHRPEKAGPAVEACREFGIFAGASSDPSLAATDWAGQVKWHRSAGTQRKCPWVINGKVIALADGRLSRCSFDASGVGVIGTLDDDFDSLFTSPYVLCATCDQDVGVPIDANLLSGVSSERLSEGDRAFPRTGLERARDAQLAKLPDLPVSQGLGANEASA
jgi:hypothetical protein